MVVGGRDEVSGVGCRCRVGRRREGRREGGREGAWVAWRGVRWSGVREVRFVGGGGRGGEGGWRGRGSGVTVVCLSWWSHFSVSGVCVVFVTGDVRGHSV